MTGRDSEVGSGPPRGRAPRRCRPAGILPRRRLPIAGLLIVGLLLPAISRGAPFPLLVEDAPNDGGGILSLSWDAPSTRPAEWQIERREPGGVFAPIDTVPGEQSSYRDSGVRNGVPYEYRLVAVPPDPVRQSAISGPAVARVSWVDTGKLNVLIVVLLFLVLVLRSIAQGQRGRTWKFRTIAGLAAIEEAIGRSTEMGKGVLYVPGVQDIDDMQTIASMVLLGYVSRMTAKYETPLTVPTNAPAVFTVAEEVVRAGYADVGRSDAYRQDQVRYITTEQFAYVAAVNGIMLRERPAANLFLGAFFAESLLLAETGHETGAIQIAGTANVHQLPFFVVACDYTLIGEEYYAASAYLSNDPRLLGSLRASDAIKVVTIAVIIVAAIALTLGHPQLATWFATQ